MRRRSLLAGEAAGHLLGLLKRPPSLPEVLTATERRIPGIVTHRMRRTDLRDRTRWRGILVTTVPRTLVDLAATLDPPALARAFHEADLKHHLKPGAVEAILARRHNWPGARMLRRAMWGDERVTLSRLESAFITTLRRAHLPLLRTNVPAGGRHVDCRWPEHRLTVELDSFRYHHTRHAWEHDRQREREARARGDEFRRYTWADVVETPAPMLAGMRELLTRPRGASAPPRVTAAS